MHKQCLLTGGAGSLGSAPVRQLVRRGDQVRVFDNDLRGRLGRLQDITGDIEFYEGDIRDPEAVAKYTVALPEPRIISANAT